MLLVRFSFCECGSVVCMSPRPAQRSVFASGVGGEVASAAASDDGAAVRRAACGSCGLRRGAWKRAAAPRKLGRDDTARRPGCGRIRAAGTGRSGRCGCARPDSPPPPGVPLAMTPPSTASRLQALLGDAMAADAVRLARRIERARASRAPAAEWERIEAALVALGRAAAAARGRGKPPIAYPPDLPVAQRADEIARAIREHPVVIVCGETGSGKTTQLPKICLAAGRGERGLIGHTQPRRIAARAVATRIAQELGCELGDAVGYKVRFTDHTRPDAYVKLMTDGILLAETQGDPAARRLRHDHRRRGARAQPQHRLPAGLPEAAPARGGPTSRSSSRRRRSTPSASRAHFGSGGRAGAGDRGVGPHVSGRDALPAAERPASDGGRRRGGARGRDRRRRRGPLARGAGRHPRVPAGRARDPRDRRPAAAQASRAGRTRRRSRSCRCTRGCRSPSSSACSRRPRGAASCSRPTSPRPR